MIRRVASGERSPFPIDGYPAPMPARDTLRTEDARHLLLHLQGLLDDPGRRVTPALLRRTIERMGFVQLDSINIVARAHHMILASRFDAYRPEHLHVLIERRRRLFEHWTHDASVIPTEFFLPWRHRCRRMADSPRNLGWVKSRLGRNWSKTLQAVKDRIADEGPRMSKDFEHKPGQASAWWGWKPSKAALEYLWWRGDLTIAARVNFHKVYDLTERCFPDLHDQDPPDVTEFVDWACRSALERLGVASTKEISDFFGMISRVEARSWCTAQSAAGTIVPVQVDSTNGLATHDAYALPGWRRRLAQARRSLAQEQARERFRLLSPFDPVIRERKRLERLFGFAYRFEAFVPAPKRKYGYYVLPVLAGDRLVARCDAKLHRKRSTLEIKGLWWEPGRGSKKDRRRFDGATTRLATFLEADTVELP